MPHMSYEGLTRLHLQTPTSRSKVIGPTRSADWRREGCEAGHRPGCWASLGLPGVFAEIVTELGSCFSVCCSAEYSIYTRVIEPCFYLFLFLLALVHCQRTNLDRGFSWQQ